jgi:predicted dinucleotide-binding enzyme
VSAVARLVDSLGFDPVPAGGIDRSGTLQPGSPVFGADLATDALRRTLTDATHRAAARR